MRRFTPMILLALLVLVLAPAAVLAQPPGKPSDTTPTPASNGTNATTTTPEPKARKSPFPPSLPLARPLPRRLDSIWRRWCSIPPLCPRAIRSFTRSTSLAAE